MSYDLAQLQRIHELEREIAGNISALKALRERRIDVVADLPESVALAEALVAVREAAGRLKLALSEDRELAKLDVEIAEAKYQLHDLREILSHHLVVYTQDTGRDVVKDQESRNRQIHLHAKLGKPALDQARLPLGLNRHFGTHVEIPAPHIELTIEETK